jgi:NAD(P)-dependent dehydrogenase (short-subunit alcohol dehydrogenase family)
MSKTIAVFGAGPGLGQAVARRYAREGYTVALVARRREPLAELADGLTREGADAHVIPADLSDTEGVPALAEQIRARVGELDAIYYGPTAGGAVAATGLTPQHVQAYMPTAVYTLVALVHEFLPPMIERRATRQPEVIYPEGMFDGGSDAAELR